MPDSRALRQNAGGTIEVFVEVPTMFSHPFHCSCRQSEHCYQLFAQGMGQSAAHSANLAFKTAAGYELIL